MIIATARRTTDRIRDELAFLLNAFDQLGIEPSHITAGVYLTAQVSGYQRTDAAIADVDRIAELLELADDDGVSLTYDRRGPVVISGRPVVVGIYTGRPQQDVTAQTPTAGERGGSTPPAVGHHPEWDGNRCSNCNARLSDADPYCDFDTPQTPAPNASIR